VRWYLGYSGIGFQGKNVREVIGEETVMYFPDEVTDSEDAVDVRANRFEVLSG